MSDPRIAALAEALAVTQGYTPEIHREVYGDTADFLDVPHEWFTSARFLAAAILDALPDDWCGHPVQVRKWREMRSEIDRLRRIEEAVRAFVAIWGETEAMESSHAFAALRAALGEKP